MAKFQNLKGFRDFYPDDFARRARIIETWRRAAKSFGFEEYDAPPLESLDLYRHKSGEELVNQLYSFVDKGGREVALRPEMTPSVARMVAARWQSLPKPLRWFSIPQLFRYERPQAGRLREHFQFNADIFGEESGRAEAELLAMIISAFRAFGLTSDDVQIRISDRRVLNRVLHDLGASEETFGVIYSVLDKYQREERSVATQRLLVAGLPSDFPDRLYATVERFRNIKSRSEISDAVGHDTQFAVMYNCLNGSVRDYQDWLTFDLTIVRGLGYYTGTVFEAFDTKGEYRAICGGGRYDGLLESLGSAPAPAVGFGWGDVVLGDLLRSRSAEDQVSPRVDWLVVGGSQAGGPHYQNALRVAAQLRELGFSAMAGLSREVPSGWTSGRSPAYRVSRFTWWIHEDQVQKLADNENNVSYELPDSEPLLHKLKSAHSNGFGVTTATVREIIDQVKLSGKGYK